MQFVYSAEQTGYSRAITSLGMSRGIPGYPGGPPRGSAGEAGPVPPRPLASLPRSSLSVQHLAICGNRVGGNQDKSEDAGFGYSKASSDGYASSA